MFFRFGLVVTRDGAPGSVRPDDPYVRAGEVFGGALLEKPLVESFGVIAQVLIADYGAFFGVGVFGGGDVAGEGWREII